MAAKKTFKKYRIAQDIVVGDVEMGEGLAAQQVLRAGGTASLDPEHAITKALFQKGKLVEFKEDTSAQKKPSEGG